MTPGRTRRQEIAGLLREGEWSFDELRQHLALTVNTLEEDLGHVRRSVRAEGRRLRVRSAVCTDCGFRLSSQALHPPGRCPSCHGRHLEGPWLTIT